MKVKDFADTWTEPLEKGIVKQKSNLDEVFFTSQTVLTERCLSFSNTFVQRYIILL